MDSNGGVRGKGDLVGVINRRNAAVGWLTLFVGKRVLKRKVKNVAFWRRG